ncbi:hypothetical protein QEG73_20385 [Chitinophagaceae bacterium 26-R-25]|nr:hypothetical protein [Chitinophagaceae bacterium 26-R-25]
MKSLVIVHFLPIEGFPPLLNLLQVITDSRKDLQVTVLTNSKSDQHYTFEIDNKRINIIRVADVSTDKSRLKRYYAYYNFYRTTYKALNKIKPENVLYFDAISSIGAYWYFKKNPGTRSKLYIHYHEYMSPQEIAGATGVMKWVFEREKELYPIAKWISQTNEERLNFFVNDNSLQQDARFHIMPNWPLKKWSNFIRTDRTIDRPLKFVYVGALSMETLYVKEFAEWVLAQKGKVTWDVFSQQQASDVRAYFKDLNSPYINFRGHCKYEDLPQALEAYHVGVILYKGHIPNYIYNAPNKLFEYHVCGLDCWFPNQMKTSMKLTTHGTYPRIAGIDFEHLAEVSNPESLVCRESLSYELFEFYAEKACEELINSF